MNKNTASIVNQTMSCDAGTVTTNGNGIYANTVDEHLLGVIKNRNTRDALLLFENGLLKDIPFEHYNVCIEPVLRPSGAALCIGLDHPPERHIFSTTTTSVIFDGSILTKRRGVYVALDANTHAIITAAYDIAEGGKDLFDFYQHLAGAGLRPKYATIDGNTQQNKYLKNVWPTIIIQRCIVHVQRQGLSWCRLHPKRTDAKHMSTLFLDLSTIKTTAAVQHFVQRVEQWEQRFGTLIHQTPDHGYVFSDLKRARHMLLNALPHLFHFYRYTQHC